MGGRIWLASNAGLGSTFHFEWAFVVSLEASVRRPRVDLSGLRVLVDDDNTTNGRILADSLTRWRMRPVTVRNGADALEALRWARDEGLAFPLMLLDMCMPEMVDSKQPQPSGGCRRAPPHSYASSP
jgi:two-component system, sensor histidine kinase and response regulator